MRYVAARVSRNAAQGSTGLIDWQQARRYALRVSQWEQASIPDRAARRAQYTRLVEQSEPLIAEYLGVGLPQPINRVYVVDRREWLEANFASFEVLFAPIEDLYTQVGARQGSLGATLGQINSTVIGAQMGVLLGFLARRVLGQYDLSLLSPDPETRGSLYFVEPNIARVQQQLGLSDEDFRLWIALHETTHVFEFEAYPWVRTYFNDLLRQFLGQVSTQLEGLGVGLPQLVGRLMGNRSSGQHWIERMLTPEQQRIFDQLQALMSLVEGYSNHIMNAIGGRLLPSFEQIEQRVQQRQQNRPLFEELFNRVTGDGPQAGAVSAGRGVRQRGGRIARRRFRQPRPGAARAPADHGRDPRAAEVDRCRMGEDRGSWIARGRQGACWLPPSLPLPAC